MTFDANYSKQRISPTRGESLYIHLSDILLALQTALKSIEITPYDNILDFGAGTSPYNFLFTENKYLKADVTLETSPDILIGLDGKIPQKDESFEIILSTQVLEHVINPHDYLQEVHRLLKHKGKFLIAVPCLYEDHKCPNDYQRWMHEGLKRDLEFAGFQNVKIYKVTVGARALLFFWDRYLDSMHSSRKKLHGLVHFFMRSIFRYPFRKLAHFFSDKLHHDLRVVIDDSDLQPFYINLLAIAEK